MSNEIPKFYAVTVIFANSIPDTEFQSFMQDYRDNDNTGKWSDAEKYFYGKRIIKDIIVADSTNPQY